MGKGMLLLTLIPNLLMMGAQFPDVTGPTVYTVCFVIDGDFRVCPAEIVE